MNVSLQKLGREDFDVLFEHWNDLCDQHDAPDNLYAPPATDPAAAKMVLAWKLADHWRMAVKNVPELEDVLTHEGASLRRRFLHQEVMSVQKN
jgi:hypothetical protein